MKKGLECIIVMALIIFLLINSSPIIVFAIDRAGQNFIDKAEEERRLGNYEQALQYYNKAIQANPKCSDFYLYKGSVLESLGRKEEAIELYKDSLKISPTNDGTLMNLANLLSELGRIDEMEQYYQNALDAGLNSYYIYYSKAKAYQHIGKMVEAIKYYDKAISEHPSRGFTYGDKAYCLLQLKRYEDALYNFNKAIKLIKSSYGDPQYYLNYLNGKIKALYGLERYQESLDAIKSYYNNIADWIPQDEFLIEIKAECLLHTQQFNEVIEWVNQKMQGTENEPYYLACAYSGLNDVNNAIKQLGKIKNNLNIMNRVATSSFFDNIRNTEEFSSLVYHLDKANTLKSLNILTGTNKGFNFERVPKKIEGAVMLVKLLGKEAYAREMKFEHPFVDVQNWATDYVGYMYKMGLTNGKSENLFGSDDEMTCNQYITFVLRALGYDDKKGDFELNKADKMAIKIGLLSDYEMDVITKKEAFLRNDMILISYNALRTHIKESNKCLIIKLIEEGAVSQDKVKESSLNNYL